jgi:hypothetical protein
MDGRNRSADYADDTGVFDGGFARVDRTRAQADNEPLYWTIRVSKRLPGGPVVAEATVPTTRYTPHHTSF